MVKCGLLSRRLPSAMATLSDLPLPQTLRLLDHVDALRQEAPTREQLVEHLQTVCETLDQPLENTLAHQAVDRELLGVPDPSFMPATWSRPATLETWKATVETLSQQRQAIRPRLRWFNFIQNVGNAVYASLGLMTLILTVTVGVSRIIPEDQLSSFGHKALHIPWWTCPVALGLTVMMNWVFEKLCPGHEDLERFDSQWSEELSDLEELPIKDRPSVQVLARWCRVPKIAEVCRQIQCSSVPFLRGDARSLTRLHEAFEEARAAKEKTIEDARQAAQRQRDLSHWDQDFKNLRVGPSRG